MVLIKMLSQITENSASSALWGGYTYELRIAIDSYMENCKPVPLSLLEGANNFNKNSKYSILCVTGSFSKPSHISILSNIKLLVVLPFWANSSDHTVSTIHI